MSETVLLISETDKQSSGFHGAGRGGVPPSTEPRCSRVQEVLTVAPAVKNQDKSTKDCGWFPWGLIHTPTLLLVEDEFDAGQLKYTFSAKKPTDWLLARESLQLLELTPSWHGAQHPPDVDRDRIGSVEIQPGHGHLCQVVPKTACQECVPIKESCMALSCFLLASCIERHKWQGRDFPS